MPDQPPQVADPPDKPLLVYDGDCKFCQLWIERWRELTGGAVDHETFQQAAARFPEIRAADFQRAIKLIESDGRVFSGAEAIYRSLGYGSRFSFGRWSYQHIPGFAAVSELAYAFIAR